MHVNVSALVYVAARAPDADEDYTARAKTYPTPPATAGIAFDGDEGRLVEIRNKVRLNLEKFAWSSREK